MREYVGDSEWEVALVCVCSVVVTMGQLFFSSAVMHKSAIHPTFSKLVFKNSSIYLWLSLVIA